MPTRHQIGRPYPSQLGSERCCQQQRYTWFSDRWCLRYWHLAQFGPPAVV